MSDFDVGDDDQPERPSKSELKRQMLALQKTGEALLNLTAAQLAEIPLSTAMREALELSKSLKHREAQRRQLQYIGKLMRTEEHEKIAAAVAELDDKNRFFRQRFHHIEQLREQLIEDNDNAFEEVLEQAPTIDRQHLRQLIRQAQKQQTAKKPGNASKKLFQYLRDALQ